MRKGAPPNLRNMRAARLFPGHEWRRRATSPYQTVANHPMGKAAKGLAALPDGGEPSHGHGVQGLAALLNGDTPFYWHHLLPLISLLHTLYSP